MEATESRINNHGQVILSSDKIRDLILKGKNINYLNVIDNEEINLFEKYQEELLKETVVFVKEFEDSLSDEEFYRKCSDMWIFPREYQKIDVKNWLIDKCKTEEEISRVEEEYRLYEERDLIMLLRLFIFLVDYMRKNKFVWGVGRGSSVSSYILYLIGIHRVDSLKYNLDIKDYLK